MACVVRKTSNAANGIRESASSAGHHHGARQICPSPSPSFQCRGYHLIQSMHQRPSREDFHEVHNGIRRESSQPNRLRSRRPNDISNNHSALIAFAFVASSSPFSSSNPFRFLSFLSDRSMISFRSFSIFRSHATQFR